MSNKLYALRVVRLFPCLLLAACQLAQIKPQTTPIAPVVAAAQTPSSPSQAEIAANQRQAQLKAQLQEQQQTQQRIDNLLQAARNAFEEDRLTSPEGDNAFDYYRLLLKMAPSNAQAHAGMRAINRRYLDWSEEQFKAGNWATAEMYLDHAERIATSPQQADAIRSRYPHPVPAKVTKANEFPLTVADLAERNERILAELGELAEKARAMDSRLLIVARSDAEGRWIYQQMRDFVSDVRLRGNIQIGNEPKVIFIDWNEGQ